MKDSIKKYTQEGHNDMKEIQAAVSKDFADINTAHATASPIAFNTFSIIKILLSFL
jgi:hypothetical protein